MKKQEKEQENKENNQTKEQEKTKEQELTELLQRVQADFENYKKRVEREKQEFCRYASHDMIMQLLPIIDSFELAFQNSEKHEEFKKGVELVYAQLLQMLEKQGLKKIDSLGKKFDPNVHEALMQGDSDKEPGTIIEEFQKGFMLNDNVIRPAKVKVSK